MRQASADIVAEVPSEKVGELAVTYTVVGEVTCRAGSPLLRYGAVPPWMQALNAWKSTLEKVFPDCIRRRPTKGEEYPDTCYQAESVYVCKHKIAKPHVFIPVFPGTNCEYDSTKAFERAGAEVDVPRYSRT